MLNYYDEEIEVSQEERIDNRRKFVQRSPTLDEHRIKIMQKNSLDTMGQGNNQLFKPDESFDSDSDMSKSDENKDKIISSSKWENLDVPADIKDCFQDIIKYTPQNIEIEYHLQPFIPDFVPAVGDVDAFLKTSCADIIPHTKKAASIQEMIKNLGLKILDEPSGKQSEPSLLHIKLRSVLTNTNTSCITPIIGRNQKEIDKWMSEIRQFHISRFSKPIQNTGVIPDIDTLMVEWPIAFEQAFSKTGFPSSQLTSSLHFYLRMLLVIFDVPIAGEKQSEYIIGLQTLFNLFLATSNSFE